MILGFLLFHPNLDVGDVKCIANNIDPIEPNNVNKESAS
jgi:hypothetical protein